MTTHAQQQRRACGLIGITRRGLRRVPAPDRNLQLRQRLRELAEERRRWGCPLLYLLMRREGWRANHKRVERLYREEGRHCAAGGQSNLGGRLHPRQPDRRLALSRLRRA
jgi:putative transposase